MSEELTKAQMVIEADRQRRVQEAAERFDEISEELQVELRAVVVVGGRLVPVPINVVAK